MCMHETWGKDFYKDVYYCDKCGAIVTTRDLFEYWLEDEPFNEALNRVAKDIHGVRCVRNEG